MSSFWSQKLYMSNAKHNGHTLSCFSHGAHHFESTLHKVSRLNPTTQYDPSLLLNRGFHLPGDTPKSSILKSKPSITSVPCPLASLSPTHWDPGYQHLTAKTVLEMCSKFSQFIKWRFSHQLCECLREGDMGEMVTAIGESPVKRRGRLLSSGLESEMTRLFGISDSWGQKKTVLHRQTWICPDNMCVCIYIYIIYRIFVCIEYLF